MNRAGGLGPAVDSVGKSLPLLSLSFSICTVVNTNLPSPVLGPPEQSGLRKPRLLPCPQIPPFLAKALPSPDLCDGVCKSL